MSKLLFAFVDQLWIQFSWRIVLGSFLSEKYSFTFQSFFQLVAHSCTIGWGAEEEILMGFVHLQIKFCIISECTSHLLHASVQFPFWGFRKLTKNWFRGLEFGKVIKPPFIRNWFIPQVIVIVPGCHSSNRKTTMSCLIIERRLLTFVFSHLLTRGSK